MLDAPFNGLDPEGSVWIRGLLRDLAAQGRAVLVASHLMAELQELAARILLVGHGRVLAAAAVRELATQHGSLEAAYLEVTRGAGGIR